MAVCVAPVVVSPTGHTGASGTAYTITNSVSAGSATIVWSLSGATHGASINSSTGTITGNHEASTFVLNVVATNDCGTDTKTVTLTTGVCVVPVMNTPTAPSGLAGASFSITNSVSAGSATIVWSLTGTIPAGVTINSSTGTVTGVLPSSSTTLTIRATNDCGFDAKTVAITVTAPVTLHTIRWGNFAAPGYPTPAPTFVESDFITNPAYTSGQTSDATALAGNYVFADDGPTLQVMWIADTVTPTSGRTFTVSGFPWGLNPSANTHIQTLIIGGVAGKVYVTTYQNSAYTVAAS